jgi:hypothetical protein
MQGCTFSDGTNGRAKDAWIGARMVCGAMMVVGREDGKDDLVDMLRS